MESFIAILGALVFVSILVQCWINHSKTGGAFFWTMNKSAWKTTRVLGVVMGILLVCAMIATAMSGDRKALGQMLTSGIVGMVALPFSIWIQAFIASAIVFAVKAILSPRAVAVVTSDGELENEPTSFLFSWRFLLLLFVISGLSMIFGPISPSTAIIMLLGAAVCLLAQIARSLSKRK